MKFRSIGSMKVSALGLGCMGMSEYYGDQKEEDSIATLQHALSLGVNFFDTADQYGLGKNEALVGRALSSVRPNVHIATKFGFVRNDAGEVVEINGSPSYVKQACEASLKRLNTDYIDLYYLHRVDARVPIEETIGAMKMLVDEGKVRYIGLSEASPQTIERAHAIHPIAALQTEYSIWSRDIESEVLPLCRDLNIAVVPYSPLGRGFLSGTIKSTDTLAENDYRRKTPRLQGDNLQHNLSLLQHLEEIAQQLKISTSQLALAWLLANGEDLIPIPGTKKISYLEENMAAVDIKLPEDVKRFIDTIAPIGAAAGDRYPEHSMKLLNK
ncbi:aldo/keto reductase [Paenibacillus radicis (ex Gao et al. 2016)]|uniref:Oxidoreductase n=1 Tax=Paenibacillus radicis (ex Gao et al. 2016) TaxID=1737354 RepID=A0A917H6U7_9BACL|nr:aldo/keto reductase [Paenibacillus radicis (ex Gao et al. 2016)]GGG68941.1 oxidoreductase [Paenibacillus radicis (ex Gao et al. 2016)]